jgi:hypothetical protein
MVFFKRLKLIAPVANNFLKDYVLIFRKLVCPLKTRRHSGVFMKQTISWYRRLKFKESFNLSVLIGLSYK